MYVSLGNSIGLGCIHYNMAMPLISIFLFKQSSE